MASRAHERARGIDWAMLERPMTVAQLCAQLATEFEVDEATCAADVSALIDELKSSRLVEPCA